MKMGAFFRNVGWTTTQAEKCPVLAKAKPEQYSNSEPAFVQESGQARMKPGCAQAPCLQHTWDSVMDFLHGLVWFGFARATEIQLQ